ncbi:hypothetical protein [Polyangium sp. y55x31]|uniref:hypothetical protein n=1 Tax=Polyangium sp. y55x31 TaxID=3042688 RepID=UPI002482F991|nr:hypothetical protein [Polyangium sp. y55x31]MDI1478928.1 hypothetical protein [Polyangium sp. y55x31]
MTVRFESLFSLRVTHEYDGGTFPDIDFVLPADTTRILCGARALTRASNGVLEAHFQAVGDRAPLVGAAGTTLRIGLRPTDPFFFNYTALPSAPPGSVAYHCNGKSPSALDAAEPRKLVGSLVAHALGLSARPVTVTLRDAAGAAIRVEEVTAARSATHVTFELDRMPPGPFSIEEAYEGAETRTTEYLTEPELLRAGVVVVVDIHVHDFFHAEGGAPAFEIGFRARKETLNYYLVIDKPSSTELEHLSVSDRGAAEEGRDEIAFTRVLDSAFGRGEPPLSLLARGGARVVLFRSQAPVARRRRAAKKIELSRNGDVLIENLPLPGADKADANQIIHISR